MLHCTIFPRRSAALFLPFVVALLQACGGGGGDSTGPGGNGTALTSGATLTNLSGDQNSQRLYRITVPAGTPMLSVITSGGTGDLDLYVRHGAAPTDQQADCESLGGANEEDCVIESPASGEWYVMLHGYEAYSGASLTAVAGEDDGSGEEPPPSQEIYFRVQQDLSYPSGSGAQWCNLPSSNFTDNNPAIADVPSAHTTTFDGPSEPGTFTASHTMSSSTVNFTYTLARPAEGFNRYYTKLLRSYNGTLNRCIDVSNESWTLTYVDEPAPAR